jgi:hypothetical protein
MEVECLLICKIGYGARDYPAEEKINYIPQSHRSFSFINAASSTNYSPIPGQIISLVDNFPPRIPAEMA